MCTYIHDLYPSTFYLSHVMVYYLQASNTDLKKIFAWLPSYYITLYRNISEKCRIPFQGRVSQNTWWPKVSSISIAFGAPVGLPVIFLLRIAVNYNYGTGCHSVIHCSCQPTIALNKIQFLTSINFLRVPARGYLPHGVFQLKGIQAQNASLCIHRTHGND